MSVLRLRAMALAIPTLAAACAGNPQPETATRTEDQTAIVQVTNNNWADMVIYVVRGGARFRLGTAPSLSTVELNLPRSLVDGTGEVELAADPVGSDRVFRTGPIHVAAGQLIELTLQNHLQISYFSVWDRS